MVFVGEEELFLIGWGWVWSGSGGFRVEVEGELRVDGDFG